MARQCQSAVYPAEVAPAFPCCNYFQQEHLLRTRILGKSLNYLFLLVSLNKEYNTLLNKCKMSTEWAKHQTYHILSTLYLV